MTNPGTLVEIFKILMMLIQVFIWILFGYCILSMLLGFRVLNPNNRFFYALYNALASIIEPVLTPIRNILPNMGGMDFSPMVLVLLIQFVIIPILEHFFLALLG
ncbi:YggT family protein [Swingsia samuiensis]|uniref:YggT family protein n=1 Tax=Swingsia samuiensis TaxID=1293412 RepID=A0A4Y6UKM6_9PROT|nr:YggT family protein [Swingsia samuiensis]QDH16941.1 YggT family protein [Swingsia samuiensis]